MRENDKPTRKKINDLFEELEKIKKELNALRNDFGNLGERITNLENNKKNGA